MRLSLFADYFQVHLQDDNIDLGDFSQAWSPEDMAARIAVVPGGLAIGTASNDTVAIDMEIRSGAPPLAAQGWEHVVEADLDIQTGRLVAAGCTDYFPGAIRFEVTPGLHRVRVLYAIGVADNGESVAPYVVQLWPALRPTPITVVKQGPLVWAG